MPCIGRAIWCVVVADAKNSESAGSGNLVMVERECLFMGCCRPTWRAWQTQAVTHLLVFILQCCWLVLAVSVQFSVWCLAGLLCCCVIFAPTRRHTCQLRGALRFYWSERAALESSIWNTPLAISSNEWCGGAVGKAWHTAACATTVFEVLLACCPCAYICLRVCTRTCTCGCMLCCYIYMLACCAGAYPEARRPLHGGGMVGRVYKQQKRVESGLHAWDWFAIVTLASIHHQACTHHAQRTCDAGSLFCGVLCRVIVQGRSIGSS